MINVAEFGHVIELLDRIAGPALVDRALRATGLTRRALREADGYVPYRLEASVVEHVARATGDAQLGAKLGDRFSYDAYGAYAQYVLAAPDLKSAIERGRRAYPLISPGSEIALDIRADYMVIGRNAGHESVVGHRHLDDGTIVIITKVLQHFLGPDWRPEWMEVGGTDTARSAYLVDMMGSPLRTGAAMPGVAVRLDQLGTRNPAPPEAHQIILFSDLPRAMALRPLTSTRDLVLHALAIQYALDDMSQEAVAQHLNIGARKLQRMLQIEGTSFRETKASFLEQHARALLTESDLGVDTIARTLGYEEPQSFRRAFRAWTGSTPHGYRTAAHGK